jgi:glycyl-tRNA synthetase
MPGIFDYGPLGSEIKIHLRKAWWQTMVYDRDDVYGIEAALLTSPLLHEHSGFLGANYEEFCVFETHIKDKNNHLSPCHLRVTTAQHSFANFDNVLEWNNPTLPFGIAQIGKAFRNEQQVTDFPVRMREFEQMELQYFVPAEDTRKWHEFWLKQRLVWWEQQGINLQHLIVDDVVADELAHYSSKTYDIHYKQPNGDIFEIEGIADRGDFDCGSHSGSQDKLHINSSVLPNNVSTALMAIKQPGAKTLLTPYAIEPAAGVDRGLMAVLFESFVCTDSSDGPSRIVLRIKPHLAPVKACLHVPDSDATLSIQSASIIKQKLQRLTDGKITIKIGGKKNKATKYHDEIGTPFFITLEDGMLNDNIILVRERDTGVTEQMLPEQFYTCFKSVYS